MNYYVKRSSDRNAAGFSYTGPIPLERAEAEVAAWSGEGCETAIIPSTQETRAAVRRWEKVSKADDARTPVWFQGQEMTFAHYRLVHETA